MIAYVHGGSRTPRIVRHPSARGVPPDWKNTMSSILKYIRTHRYVLYVLYVPFYLCWFFLLEHLVTTNYWVSYLPLDDKIPFLPGFALVYCCWFPFLLLPGLYWLFCDVPAFKRYLWFLMIGFSVSMLICSVFPNGQNLRPTSFSSDGFCVRLVQALYRADTNTNVLPSMHVVGAFAVVYGALHSRKTSRPGWLAGFIGMALLICCSTVLIKQHSVLDIFAGIAVSIPVWIACHFIARADERRSRREAERTAEKHLEGKP